MALKDLLIRGPGSGLLFGYMPIPGPMMSRCFINHRALKHWSLDRMAANFRIYKNVFSGIKIYKLWLRFHLNLFQRIQLTIFQHWSDNCFTPTRHQAIIWTNDGSVYLRIYASLGLNELKDIFQLLRWIFIMMCMINALTICHHSVQQVTELKYIVFLLVSHSVLPSIINIEGL